MQFNFTVENKILTSNNGEFDVIADNSDYFIHFTFDENLLEYGTNLGLTFQIIDDILDVTGDEAVLGKPIGSDDENGKTTFVTLLGLYRAKIVAKELTDEALGLLSKFSRDTTNLRLITSYLLERNY